MNTAKNLQLLDVQSNNISPATNIESLYYEVNQNGVIYRNAIYRHFPVYVKYNNNLDDPIHLNGSYSVYGATVSNGSITIAQRGNKTLIDDATTTVTPSGQVQKRDASTYILKENSTSDLLVSSIRQTKLANTRYYKLDISTYNLSDILSLYSPRDWVQDVFNIHDASIHNIVYESPIMNSLGEQVKVYTPYDVGNLKAGTDLAVLNGKTLNKILDMIFIKEARPYGSNITVTLTNPESTVTLYDPTQASITISDAYKSTIIDGSIYPVYMELKAGTATAGDSETPTGLAPESLTESVTVDVATIKSAVSSGAPDSYFDIASPVDVSVGTTCSALMEKWGEFHTNLGNAVTAADVAEILEPVNLVVNDIQGTRQYPVQVSDDNVTMKGSIYHRVHVQYVAFYCNVTVGATPSASDWQLLYITSIKGSANLEFTQNQSNDTYVILPTAILSNSSACPTLTHVHEYDAWRQSNNWMISNNGTMTGPTTETSGTTYTKYKVDGDKVSGSRGVRIQFGVK